MSTAKALGFKKGDCVAIGCPEIPVEHRFVGVIMSDVHTASPCVEVWGLAHEGGSCRAHDLQKITKEEVLGHKYYKEDPRPFSKVAQNVLGVPARK